jgi:hypothetical protein
LLGLQRGDDGELLIDTVSCVVEIALDGCDGGSGLVEFAGDAVELAGASGCVCVVQRGLKV